MKYSIVVPCYNEEENIPLLLERFAREMGERNDVELILVNNGSTDGSGAVMDELLPLYPMVRRVTVAVNQGYGFGILSGLRAAEGAFLGWTHADLQTDPADVLRALTVLEVAATPEKMLVKGNRKGRPLIDRFFTFNMSLLELLLTGRWLNDINAQPNMFSRDFFLSWKNPPYDFSLDLYAFYMAKKQGLEIRRFPVRFPERIHGSSKWNTGLKAKWRFIKRTASYSFKLTKGGVD
ncbi:MAG: glycosyltransferase family 2 protein [Oscillospiraceae bacterium]|nr:glycosyltransferase family 2 protein [Oscillospiraceae bacterium]